MLTPAVTGKDDDPVGGDEFAALMDRLGPFEAAPLIAVAVSGGADSLALCLLAADWARARGGRAVGVTIDHALRPESAQEARQVGLWLAHRSIEHHTLVWNGLKPISGIQAAARQARYDLLRRWCAERGVLHLLLAHHRDDQAETVLLRLQRGSGPDGLAVMPAIAEWPETRLLRPLLKLPGQRLKTTLTVLGQDWIEDPSNQNEAFHRVRIRRALPMLADAGLDPVGLTDAARRYGLSRRDRDLWTAWQMARSVELYPQGWAWMDWPALACLPKDQALRLLGRVCLVIGGGVLPHRQDRLERLYRDLCAAPDRRRTFGGCVLAPGRSGVVVQRELAAMPPPMPVEAGQTIHWDNRFIIRLAGAGDALLAPLGGLEWARLRKTISPHHMPSGVISTLPALFDQHGVFAAPHLGYNRGKSGEKTSGLRGAQALDQGVLRMDEIFFSPESQMASARYCLV